MSGPRKRRKQREARWLEQQTQDALESREGPSGGQYYILNTETWEKTPGLNYKEARELWGLLPKAMIFTQDLYKKKPAPGKAIFDAGQLP